MFVLAQCDAGSRSGPVWMAHAWGQVLTAGSMQTFMTLVLHDIAAIITICTQVWLSTTFPHGLNQCLSILRLYSFSALNN